MNMRQKRDLNLMNRVIPVKKTIKDWYFHAGMKFLNQRPLNDSEEKFLEEVTEFYMSVLDNIEDIERKISEEISNHDDNYDALSYALRTEHYDGSKATSAN